MVVKFDTLTAIQEAEDECTARELADHLDVELAEAALALLRCYRAGLLERYKEDRSASGQAVYQYSLTTKGDEWLCWYHDENTIIV